MADTIDGIKQQASQYASALVFCSFGKESLTAVDLCAKHFQRVDAVCMSYAPGMQWFQKWQQYARNRWGIQVREIEHWGVKVEQACGYRCKSIEHVHIPKLKETVEAEHKASGCDIVVTGARMAESLGRRRTMVRGNWPGYAPLAHWLRADVYAYLQANNLPVPDSEVLDMGGIGLDTKSLLWLHDRYPDDFALLRKRFPYVGAVVKRREWFGVGVDYRRSGDHGK